VAYTEQTGTVGNDETLIWIDRADGSDPQPLTFQTTAWKQLVGWTPDGSRLLYADSGGGLTAVRVDADSPQQWPAEQVCPDPCLLIGDGFSLAPDGSHVAFVRRYGIDGDDTVVAVMELSTGRVTELESTRTSNPRMSDCLSGNEEVECEGLNDDPVWSPDGTRLAFARHTGSVRTGGIFVADVDGKGLRQVASTGQRPRWSPDGSQIAFISTEHVLDPDTPVNATAVDIYSVSATGSDLMRLTDDGVSWVTSWTSDGGIAYVRILDRANDFAETQTWVMDADGSTKRQIPRSLPELTAAGCVVCIYPGISEAYWQPTGNDR
jgi:Tol biopolymer transport system component